MRTEFEGHNLSRGINFIEVICPGGQEVGDRILGIKWVRDQMRRSHIAATLYFERNRCTPSSAVVLLVIQFRLRMYCT